MMHFCDTLKPRKWHVMALVNIHIFKTHVYQLLKKVFFYKSANWFPYINPKMKKKDNSEKDA